jgi:hypothetical protein
MWNASFLRGLSDAAPTLVHNDVVVSSVPAQKTSNADDGVVFSGLGKRASSGRNLKRARNANEIDVLLPYPGTQERVIGALK